MCEVEREPEDEADVECRPRRAADEAHESHGDADERERPHARAREAEVVRLVAQGLRNGEIAERLRVTPKTVDHHVSAALSKLGARSRLEAVREAARLGLLEQG